MRGEDGVFCSHAALIDPEADFEMAQVLKKHLDRFRAYWSINPNYPERIEKDIKQFSGWRDLSDLNSSQIIISIR